MDQLQGFEFLHVAMSDYGNQNIQEVLPQCFEFIQGARAKEGKVLVHCRGGVNRSATVVLAWMMHGEKMILKDAWHLLRSRRSVVSPHEQYIAQLKSYEETLFGTITLTPEDTGLSAQARMRQFMLLGKKGIVDAANQQETSSAPDLLKRGPTGPAPRLSRGSVSGLGSGSSSILVRESNSQPTAPEIEGMSQASLAIEVASKDSPLAIADSKDRSESSTTGSRSESPGMSRKGRSPDAKKHKKHRHHGRSGSNVSNSGNSLTSDNDSTTSSLRQSEKSHTEASDSSHSARTGSSSRKTKKKKSSTSLSTSDSSTSIRSRSPSIHTDSDTSSQPSKRKLPAVNEEEVKTGEPKPKTHKRTSRSSNTPAEPKPAGSASESDHTVAAPEKSKRSKSKTATEEPETAPSATESTPSKSPAQSPRTLKNLFSGLFGRTKASKKDSSPKATVAPVVEESTPQDDKSSSSEEKPQQSDKKSHRKKGDRSRGHSKRMVHSSSFSISASTSTSTSSGRHSAEVVNSSIKHDAHASKHIPANIKILSQERTSTSARSSSSTSSSGT
jgi:trimeric autotransporter adhesin